MSILRGAAAGLAATVPMTIAGVTHGLAVWVLAYGVGLPSLGLHRAVADDTTDRNEVLIASHLVWGAALGGLSR